MTRRGFLGLGNQGTAGRDTLDQTVADSELNYVYSSQEAQRSGTRPILREFERDVQVSNTCAAGALFFARLRRAETIASQPYGKSAC